MSKPRVLDAGVVRTGFAPFELTRADSGGDGLTLEGYAAVFDTPTRIDSWEGTFDEKIARGAFRKSIREKTPVLQFDHGRHPLVGSVPLGSIKTLREDDNGLYVKARLHDNWMVEPIRDAIESGSVNGMSFRFIVVKDEWRDSKGTVVTDPEEVARLIFARDPKNAPMRTLREVKTPELGPVVFPAYTSTSVGVRDDLLDLANDPEGLRALARAAFVAPPSTPPASDSDEPDPAGGAARTTEEPGNHSDPSSDEAKRRAAAHARHRRALDNGVHE